MKKKLVIWGLIIAALLVYFVVMPYFALQQANELYDNGQYAEAYEKYETLSSNIFFSSSVADHQRTCQTKLAEEAVAAQEYEKAIDLYTQLGQRAKVTEVQRLQADHYSQQGEHNRAAELYEKLKDTEKATEAWMAHSEKCLAEKNFSEAISVYEKLGKTELIPDVRLAWAEHSLAAGQEADIPSVLKGLTGDAIAQYHFDAFKAAAEKDTTRSAEQIAGEYGTAITDINTQLKYCSLLKGAEIDLAMVYPDGVVVDVDLSQYQMVPSIIYQNIVGAEPVLDCSKILVFSREEQKPQLKHSAVSSEAKVEELWDKASESRLDPDYGYTVRLQPGLMSQLLDGMLAGTLEECTSIVLLEKGYYPDNCLQIKSTSSYSYSYTLSTYNSTTTYKPYISYYAYEGINIYSVSNPLDMVYYDCYINGSLLSNSVVGNSYSDSGLDLTAEQINEILEALEATEDPASQEILAKYPQETIDFVSYHGWGNYLYIPETDAEGNAIGKTYSTDDTAIWATEKYMLGLYEEGWLEAQLADNAIGFINLYLLVNSWN